MRQNTWRMAIGMFFRGFSDSPAAMPISSVPWNEKPAIIATPTIAWKPPTKGASPMVKLLKPGDSTPCMMPKMVARPTPMKITTVTTLIRANQNSLSPKPRAEITLRPNMMPRKIALQ
ncbi:Uncharacterised protein [Pseudomonas aeruginosa]|nr:Uncharacterised protein [Pseudomonas aeruginosa]